MRKGDEQTTMLTNKDSTDILNRKEFVDSLVMIATRISDRRGNCSFAINGVWGCGKTFVLDLFIKELSELKLSDGMTSRFLIFPYNCWQYDYYDEPTVAIVSAMLGFAEEQYNSELDGLAKDVWKTVIDIMGNVAGEILHNKIGIDLVAVARDIKKNGDKRKSEAFAFDKQFAFKKALDAAREAIKALAKDQTLVIIVDELDRCLPEYAIKVLERLHHLFDGMENAIVILSVDRSQLDRTVEKIYGNKSAPSYLRKFIDFEVQLDTGTLSSSLLEKYEDYIKLFDSGALIDSFTLEEYYSAIFDKIDVRAQIKIIEKAKLLHDMIFDFTPDYAAMFVELLWLVLSYMGCANNKVSFFGIDFHNNGYSVQVGMFPNITFSSKIQAFFKKISSQKIILLESNRGYSCQINSASYAGEVFFWYWNMLFEDPPQKISINIPPQNPVKIQDTSEKLKRFIKLAEIIN